ncbi:pyrroline-5-carboxylate reductase [Alicyclobacillus fastidiosus]|uniref:Pyrroline-5-carboxylate reductase n=1 Tax=Alicyclobacillus fastidiosus TaxID=392011 RepID=A0ABY6ZI74_9BACL|nr:pyrroline-5-carboxylate reductase [Alicyclobacillus fastidiosus]WAH42623.1 pyrroline-5-carboxylate reductase [Alicyclobacillus fastidiosus]GMA64495.1 pyrroline-5-carboxylate reductase 2 [Alicyclobacillus fastidiosus]
MDKIFVLGAGAMAESFIKGVSQDPDFAVDHIYVINRHRPERLVELQRVYGVTPASSMEEARGANVIVLTVKPYDVRAALRELLPYLDGQIIISFAAGIPISFMEEITERRAHVIRTMPNVPVAVLEGAIAMAVGESVDAKSVDVAKRLLEKLGIVVELAEELMDAATAFSGSGPGFVSYFLEAMEDAAVGLGFSAEMARQLLIQTVVGTAKVLEEWGLSPAELKARVTSPNGTTHAGLTVLADRGMGEAIAHALVEAKRRSKEMGEQFTKES